MLEHCLSALSNYIFILDLTPGFNGLGREKFKCKTRQESFKFGIMCAYIRDFTVLTFSGKFFLELPENSNKKIDSQPETSKRDPTSA